MSFFDNIKHFVVNHKIATFIFVALIIFIIYLYMHKDEYAFIVSVKEYFMEDSVKQLQKDAEYKELERFLFTSN